MPAAVYDARATSRRVMRSVVAIRVMFCARSCYARTVTRALCAAQYDIMLYSHLR